eukprot:COSAG06_NODE_2318_length_7091_cov_16.276173_7_plen_50_part_00
MIIYVLSGRLLAAGWAEGTKVPNNDDYGACVRALTHGSRACNSSLIIIN